MNINNKWLWCVLFSVHSVFSATLIDQSAFILEQNLYTLHDIRPYLMVKQGLNKEKINLAFSKDAYEIAREMMIQDLIVDEYLSKVNINDEQTQNKLQQAFQAFLNDELQRSLKQYNIALETLYKAYVHEYKKEQFIAESIAFRAKVDQSSVENYYQEHQDQFLSFSQEDALQKIQQSMEKNELVVQYNQWLNAQLQRKKIVLFSFDNAQ